MTKIYLQHNTYAQPLFVGSYLKFTRWALGRQKGRKMHGMIILTVLLQASVAFFFPGMLTTFFRTRKYIFISPKTTALMLLKYPTILKSYKLWFSFISTPYFLVISYISEVSYGSSEQIFVRNVASKDVTEGVPWAQRRETAHSSTHFQFSFKIRTDEIEN